VGRDLIFGKALIIYFSSPDRDSMENAKPERAGFIIKQYVPSQKPSHTTKISCRLTVKFNGSDWFESEVSNFY
jgi:hypothetical protein